MPVGSVHHQPDCCVAHAESVSLAPRPRLIDFWCGFYFYCYFFAAGSMDALHLKAGQIP